MSTDPGQTRARSSSPGAERMRRYRKRRRQGPWFVRVPLDAPEIDDLIRLKFLEASEGANTYAAEHAIGNRELGTIHRP